MRIAIIMEGETEGVFLPHLRAFLGRHLAAGSMPNIDPKKQHGRIPTGDRLKRMVDRFLKNGPAAYDHVIALTDVYTGTDDFRDAQDAKNKMRAWVGNNPRFHPHAAQHDFEAWLIPYWPTIQKLADSSGTCPSGPPESLNHGNPPAYRLKDLFERGKTPRSYQKRRDAGRILRDNDLGIAIEQCLELKALVNTILKLSGGKEL